LNHFTVPFINKTPSSFGLAHPAHCPINLSNFFNLSKAFNLLAMKNRRHKKKPRRCAVAPLVKYYSHV
jgi:hypothetical protein